MTFTYRFYFNFFRNYGLYGWDESALPFCYYLQDEVEADDDYIIKSSVERVLRFHKDLEPNSNTLKFQMKQNSMLGANTIMEWLLEAIDDIHIRVTRSADGVNYSPYFSGFLSDNYKIKVNHDGIELIDFQAEDYTNKVMKKKWASINSGLFKSNYISKTNSSADAAKSLVSKICGYHTSYRVNLRYNINNYTLTDVPNITNTIPAYYLPADSDTTSYEMLKSLLYEYGYTFYFDEAGYLVVKSYRIPSDANPTVGFYNTETTRNILGKIEISRIRPRYKYVQVRLNTVKTLTNQIVFTDTTGGDSINKCNIVLPAGTAYPEGSEEFSDVSQNTYADYKLESGEEIIAVDGTTLDIIKDSQISIVRSQNLNDKMNLKLLNEGASDYTIRKLDVLGNTVYCTDQMIVQTYGKNQWNETEGESKLEYEAKYISNAAEGYYLAQTLGEYFKYANLTYTINSRESFAIGDIVKIEEDIISGINTVAQIMERKDYADSDVITYTCVGVAPITVETPIKTEFLNTPTPAVANTVNKQDVGQIVKAIERKQIFFNTNTSIVIPMDIYPTGGAVQADYAAVIDAAVAYPDVNFFVILKSTLDNASYEDVIKKMRDVGINVLVYIDTNFTNIPIETVKANINTIVSGNPNIDGLFVDRVPIESPMTLNTKNYYLTLKNHATLAGLYPLIMNTDGLVPQEYYEAAIGDIFVVQNREEYPAQSDLNDYVDATNPDQYNKTVLISNRPFDGGIVRSLLNFSKIIYHTEGTYANPAIVQTSMAQTLNARFDLSRQRHIGGSTFHLAHAGSNIVAHATVGCNLTKIPSKFQFWKTLSTTLTDQLDVLSGSTSWQEIIDSVSAVTPRTPTVSVTEFVSTAELSWEYQTDLGPALKYYEILVSKDHDPEDSDPDNGTWWKPRNDGVDWWFEDDDEPLQVTTEFYTFKAPLDLDEDDNSIPSTYFFKVRRVSTSNSGWGYSSATLRPLNSVEIGKDTILAPHIMAGAITADKIAANTITAAHIQSVDGGAIKTGNIQSETYSQGTAGWKLALSGSAEFNDVTVRGTVFATDGTFSGSINSGPLMLNKNPPSTASTTITSGNSFVTWLRALQSSASITSGSFNCSGTYNGTSLGRIEISQITETPIYEQWQQTGTHTVTTTTWNPYATYVAPVIWTDSWGVVHVTPGYWQGAYVTSSVTVEDDVLWSRTTVKYTYQMKLYDQSNTMLVTLTDWYETAGTWVNTGTTGTNQSASTSAPSAASATQGTVNFAQSGSVSFTASAYTYRLINLPTADTGLPAGSVYTYYNSVDGRTYLCIAD